MKKQISIFAVALLLSSSSCIPTFASDSQSVQMPIPTTAAEVPAPPPGTTLPPDYVRMVGRMAYLWGWPLVNAHNRRMEFGKAPELGLVGGIIPAAPLGQVAMLSDYVNPNQKFITCPNQDVVYGAGFFALDKDPVVFQVPDFGDRFWVYALYDGRTDEFSRIGKQYHTKPGFYLVVGPNWQGKLPAGINAILKSSTDLVFAIPRIFKNDTAEDSKAIQPVINQIMFYPLSQYDGKMKTKDWSQLPHFPAPKAGAKGEVKWVVPEVFFNELPEVMKEVPPLPGEEALYRWIGSVLDAAAKDPAIMQILKETAVASERELIAPYFQVRYNGGPVGNGWSAMVNGAQFGTDYDNRTAMAKASMYGNRAEETRYFATDFDTQGKPLTGENTYAITFTKVPPVMGFWSLTLYNSYHMFNPNPLQRFSLGTKNKTLKYNSDGSLTLYAGSTSPGKDKENNWLPAPAGAFTLFLRAYAPDPAVLDGTWTPPAIQQVKGSH